MSIISLYELNSNIFWIEIVKYLCLPGKVPCRTEALGRNEVRDNWIIEAYHDCVRKSFAYCEDKKTISLASAEMGKGGLSNPLEGYVAFRAIWRFRYVPYSSKAGRGLDIHMLWLFLLEPW